MRCEYCGEEMFCRKTWRNKREGKVMGEFVCYCQLDNSLKEQEEEDDN